MYEQHIILQYFHNINLFQVPAGISKRVLLTVSSKFFICPMFQSGRYNLLYPHMCFSSHPEHTCVTEPSVTLRNLLQLIQWISCIQNLSVSYLHNGLLCHMNAFETAPSPVPLSLSSRFLVYSPAHQNFCLRTSIFLHDFWGTACHTSCWATHPLLCVCVALEKHISVSQGKACLSFQIFYGTWVNNAEVSQIPVEFAKWTFQFKQQNPPLPSWYFS